MLISPEYKEQQQGLHSKGTYGVSGHKYARPISELCQTLETRDVLDYGCGQRFLERALGFPINNYDPCIEGLDSEPKPADIVACCDCLEHIEPEYLDAVLDDLMRVVKRVGFFVIDTQPAQKVLADGRNAHLIQEGGAWWIPRILERFRIVQYMDKRTKLIFLVEKA